MKRLAWLMLLAFGTLLMRAPAVEPLAPATQHCACGDTCAGRCGMPDCALPAAPTAPQFAADRAVMLVRPATKREARLGERPANPCFSVPLASLDASPALRASVRLAPPASVPLFKEHCSFLI